VVTLVPRDRGRCAMPAVGVTADSYAYKEFQESQANKARRKLREMSHMRRTTFNKLLGWIGTSLGVVLLVAGGLLLWGSAYVHNTVQSQLAAQQITFPPASAFAHPAAGTEITPSMIPSVSQYAGQPLLTGQQAEAYADHFIAQHIINMGGGKTYSRCPPSRWRSLRTPR
jgi:hypothetical protein